MAVPNEALLCRFFSKATAALEGVEIDASMSRSQIRSLLLEIQLSTLSQVVLDENHQLASGRPAVRMEEVQAQLKSLNGTNNSNDCSSALVSLSDRMNHAARKAFAKLVLYSGLRQETCFRRENHQECDEGGNNASTKRLVRKDILEFCGLCQNAWQLDEVAQHLQTGRPVFSQLATSSLQPETNKDSTTPTTKETPIHRLKHIQSIFFQTLGYDPAVAHSEMEKILWALQKLASDEEEDVATIDNNTEDNDYMSEFRDDATARDVVMDMLSATRLAMSRAFLPPGETTTKATTLSDVEHGGVTRVVAVEYSELDARTGETVASQGVAPTRQSMDAHHNHNETSQHTSNSPTKHESGMQVAAASLQQEIYQELLQLSDEERELKLQEARTVTREFLDQVASKPPGPERLEFLTSMDAETQKLMIMQRLWESSPPAT